MDIRPVEQRSRDGDIPEALVIDRKVLEWRLAPSSPSRIVGIDIEQKVILAAATIRRLGVNATDLISGF